MSGFDALPDELVLYVLAFLEEPALVAMAQVSHRLRVLSCDVQYSRPAFRLSEFPVTSATRGVFGGRPLCVHRVDADRIVLRGSGRHVAVTRSDPVSRLHGSYRVTVFAVGLRTTMYAYTTNMRFSGDRLVSIDESAWIETPRVPPPLVE